MPSDAIAFIPARGGSKRVPRKNIRLLAGKPLLAWSVEAALESRLFSCIVVSSDDSGILDVARSCGAETDMRPAELATDTSRNVEVIAEYLGRPCNAHFHTVVVLPPTSPLRDADDIRAAFAFWEKKPDDFVISVSNYDFPPEFACNLDAVTGELKLCEPETYARSTQSQSVLPSVHPNGAIYLGSTARFLREGTFFAPPMRGFSMPPERSLDLDYPYQFALAEAVIQSRL